MFAAAGATGLVFSSEFADAAVAKFAVDAVISTRTPVRNSKQSAWSSNLLQRLNS